MSKDRYLHESLCNRNYLYVVVIIEKKTEVHKIHFRFSLVCKDKEKEVCIVQNDTHLMNE